jgi:heme exporter protein CcmD
MHGHAFYIALAYGAGLLLIAAEVASLYLAGRRSRQAALHEEQP